MGSDGIEASVTCDQSDVDSPAAEFGGGSAKSTLIDQLIPEDPETQTQTYLRKQVAYLPVAI
jgi:hypothetical protein